MRTEEFIGILSERSKSEEALFALRGGTPLGLDAAGGIVLSQTREHIFTARHTCITGARRTTFIRRLIVQLSCLYESSEANFLVLSPRQEYGELLRLKNADITVPFVRTNADVEKAKACVRELIGDYARGVGYPKLFLVLDGLEELPECNINGDLEEYRAFFELLARQKNVEIISGAELMKSIFSGNPGVFVGVGNCLVTTREEGRADVTYVGEDSSLSMPTAMTFPDSPSVLESIIYLNALPSKNGGEDA
ncbi:MAG: hypothetical protein IJX96_05650 [Clostridia bacterium]|nr:hypothetical protein [Clostridia bacterium]